MGCGRFRWFVSPVSLHIMEDEFMKKRKATRKVRKHKRVAKRKVHHRRRRKARA